MPLPVPVASAPVAAPPVVVETPRVAPAPVAKPPPVLLKETPKERRARESRERDTRLAAAGPAATGVLRLAISPWGQVEVDGKPMGTAPPLNELTLSEGRHTITIRNDEFPPYSSSVTVVPGQPVSLKYRFGS